MTEQNEQLIKEPILKNTLGDLNNHLFAELERLDDEELSEEALQREIKRADAVAKVATVAVNNANTLLKARTAYGDNFSADPKDRPRMLEG